MNTRLLWIDCSFSSALFLFSRTIDVFANDEFASGLRDDGIGISKQSNVLKQPTKSSEVCITI